MSGYRVYEVTPDERRIAKGSFVLEERAVGYAVQAARLTGKVFEVVDASGLTVPLCAPVSCVSGSD